MSLNCNTLTVDGDYFSSRGVPLPLGNLAAAGFLALLTATGFLIILLSLLGCAVIVFTYWKFRDLRTRTRQLLVVWSAVDGSRLLLNIFCEDDELLLSRGYLRSVSLLCPTIFLVHICWTIAEKEPIYRRNKFFSLYGACFGLPLLAEVIYQLALASTSELSPLDSEILTAAIRRGDIWTLYGFVALPVVCWSINRHVKYQTRQHAPNPFTVNGTTAAATALASKIARLVPAFFLFNAGSAVSFLSLLGQRISLCLQLVNSKDHHANSQDAQTLADGQPANVGCAGTLYWPVVVVAILQMLANAQGAFNGLTFCWKTPIIRSRLADVFDLCQSVRPRRSCRGDSYGSRLVAKPFATRRPDRTSAPAAFGWSRAPSALDASHPKWRHRESLPADLRSFGKQDFCLPPKELYSRT